MLGAAARALTKRRKAGMPRILYIEDNADNRLLVRRILQASDRQYIVDEAENAVVGIRIAREMRPDLILMDLSMPDLDGLTATQLIRTIPELSDVPIVALTANVMRGDRERTLEAGCDGYIGKPIDVDKFANEIEFYLRRQHERGAEQPRARSGRTK